MSSFIVLNHRHLVTIMAFQPCQEEVSAPSGRFWRHPAIFDSDDEYEVFGAVTLYKGLGGDHIIVWQCDSVSSLVLEVELRTDWLWGKGEQLTNDHRFPIEAAYKFIDLDKGVQLKGDHQFSPFNIESSVVLQYLPSRITDVGFPCRICKQFIFWDSGWFTKYQHCFFPFTEWSWRTDAFYHPRIYICIECGVSSPEYSTYDRCS